MGPPTVSINAVETTNSPCLSTSHIVTHRSAATITLDLVKYCACTTPLVPLYTQRMPTIVLHPSLVQLQTSLPHP